MKIVTGTGLMALLVVGGALRAGAHVTIEPDSAPKGAGDQVITFRVPNENDKASTISLQVQLPQEHPIAAVDALAMPGWTSKIDMVHLATPIKTDDGEFADVASVITWTGGKIAPGEYGEFKILAMGLPSDADTLTFKALQGYSDGTTVSWIDVAVAGQPEPDHPAPVLTLTAEATDASAAAATDAATSDGGASPDASSADTEAAAATSPSSSSSSSKSSNTAGAIGIALGGAGLLVALAALARTRRSA